MNKTSMNYWYPKMDDRWYMIDMATAMQSWHPPCEKWDCGI